MRRPTKTTTRSIALELTVGVDLGDRKSSICRLHADANTGEQVLEDALKDVLAEIDRLKARMAALRRISGPSPHARCT